MGKLFQELKRRNVVRVGVAYLALVWVVLQVTELAVPALNLPESLNSIVFYLGAIGFPFALFFAWAFELTPEGLMKTEEVDKSSSVTHSTGRKLDFIIIGLLAVAVSWLVIDRFAGGEDTPLQASASSGSIDKSIAVLPFENFSSDEELGWFADGLSDEILNALSRTPDLEVTSRTSSFMFRNPVDEISVIAEKLGVAHILEGSVRGDGNRIRVTAQLIRTADDVHLWSNTYDRDPDDIITIQEEIALAIAQELETLMDPQALAAMVQAGTSSAAAYEVYLKGRAIQEQGFSDGNFRTSSEEAYALYEEARTLDPGFAQAHFRAAIHWSAQLSIATIGFNLEGVSTSERVNNFRQRIEAAIASATSEGGGLRYRSQLSEIDSRYRERIRLLEQYSAIDPNDVINWIILSTTLAEMNRLDEALEAFHSGVVLLTDDILFYSRYIQLPKSLGQPNEAIPIIEKALTLDPTNLSVIYQSHRAYLWSDRLTDAAELLARVEGLPSGDISIPMMRLRQACAENRQVEAEGLYRSIMQDDDMARISIQWLASALMGEPEIMDELLRPYDTPGSLISISSFLSYPYFDPTPFANLSAMLEREGSEARTIVQIPFACKPL